jgi:class 3 adenylate cyclase/tetratricopeptide (TPR) repeat protein
VTEVRRERKIVTVLFADLVGFTSRAEQLDPEDVDAELSRYHTKVRGDLEHFGGTVEKFIGDAAMAVFGAPVAHEDDPERAVRAAIAVRDWALQEGLELRIGITTGEALIRLGARPEAGEGMAVGDVVNTAARLQAAAPVNGILVGERTFRATERAIEYRSARPVEAKGKAQPVTAWEAVEPRSRLGVEVEQVPRTGLIGRGRELGLLRAAFERARAEREPQLVTLVGVPGIGKTRIVFELSRFLDADHDLITWRHGRCLPYGDGVSFWALGEIVKAEAGILESDGPEAAAKKLTASVAALVAATDADWVERRLRPLVGLAGEEPGRGPREESFPAWRRFLEGLAESGPAVLVFEDLHWADDGLLDFLDELAEWTSGIALLVVCTARPELLSRRTGWGGGRTNALTLSLPPLSAEETARLVHELLERTMLPAELQRAVLERAGGNPLYAEEFALMLKERGDAERAVPETVQGIIAARLDALEPEHKRLLQDAAVVGKVFWAGAVAALDGTGLQELERGLRELERRELVRRERRSSVEGETEYAFRHVLVRDVAYGQIPRVERSERHRSAAEWIAHLGRPDDHAELLAYHYLKALEYAGAAGLDTAELAAPALAALREAGERAYALGAYPSAARYFRAALDLTGEDDPERAELLFRSGAAQFWSEGTGEDVLAETVSRLQHLDRETAARAALLLSRAAWARGDSEAVGAWLAEVDGLLADHPLSIVRTEALVVRSSFYMLAGDYEQAIGLAREALVRVEGVERPELRARLLDVIGTSRVAQGDEGGIEDQRRAVEAAREGRAIFELHTAINNLGVSMARLGRLRDAEETAAERRAIINELGVTAYTLPFLVASEADADYCAGRWTAALEAIEGFLAGLPEGATHTVESDLRAMRAMIQLARDRVPEARADVERACAVASSSRDAPAVAYTLCVRAMVALAEGLNAAAAADFEELLVVGDPLDEGLLNNGAHLPAFAWLALDLGRPDDVLAVLDRPPSTPWTRVGQAILAGDAAGAADLLAEIGHRPAEAYARLRAGGDQIERALDFYRSVGATLYIREGAALLGTSAGGTR